MSVSYKIATSTASSSSVVLTNGTTTTLPWVNTTTGSFSIPNNNPILTIPHGENKVVLDKEAALEVKGKLRLNGIDLEERLQTIETVLNIPTRDAIIENKYPKLAEIHKQYMKELEKYKTWERIKGENNETTAS